MAASADDWTDKRSRLNFRFGSIGLVAIFGKRSPGLVGPEFFGGTRRMAAMRRGADAHGSCRQ